MITALLGYSIMAVCGLALAALQVAIRKTPPARAARPPVRRLAPELVPCGGMSGAAIAVALMECGFSIVAEPAGVDPERITAHREGGVGAVASLDPVLGWSVSAPPVTGYPGMLYYPVSPADLIGFVTKVYAQGPHAVRPA